MYTAFSERRECNIPKNSKIYLITNLFAANRVLRRIKAKLNSLTVLYVAKKSFRNILFHNSSGCILIASKHSPTCKYRHWLGFMATQLNLP